MTVTNGYVERAIVFTLAEPEGLSPLGPDEDPETTPVVDWFSGREGSVKEVQDQLRGMTDAKVRSRAVSIRRAFNRLEEKGLVDRSGVEGGREYYSLTDRGLEEAKELYEGFTGELKALQKMYGGDWSGSWSGLN